MGYAVYRVGTRWGGYGVPAVCEHPDCNEEIDRGMAYACGGEPFSEYGCDRYFCGKHRQVEMFDPDADDGRCHHDDDCECEWKEVCERCAKGEASFDKKPEDITWLRHLLRDASWYEWRKKNPREVQEIRQEMRARAEALKA